jgi:itaconate CoA-transferase
VKRLPLEGLTVVSLEQAVAAPFASRQLGDLGARVIKVERPEGDFARGYDTKVHGMSSYFVWLNRNKESICLDLRIPEDKIVMDSLMVEADVFIQNLAPGAVDRLGFGAERIRKLNPGLIYVSISGFGDGGPYTDKKAYDLLIACESGLLSLTGTDDHLARVGISVADISGGMYAYSGVLAALHNRAATGQGDHLRISLLDALGEWMGQPYFYREYGGVQQKRSGAHHATIAPYGPVPVADGTVFLSIQNQREWEALCTVVLGAPYLLDDPRFATNDDRVMHRSELAVEIESVTTLLTTTDACRLLDQAKIANAQVRDMDGMSQHPQLEARDRWQDVDSPVGRLRTLKPPVISDGIDYRWDAIPDAGQDSLRIRAEMQSSTNQGPR